jgi:hypothetical protein
VEQLTKETVGQKAKDSEWNGRKLHEWNFDLFIFSDVLNCATFAKEVSASLC